MSFNELGLSQPVLQALDMKGYDKPTPIQQQSIPTLLEGRDLLGIAQTGTGKTAAFMLPSIDNLRDADRQTPYKSCRMLVLAPTRELAGQIAQSAKDYGALAGLKVHCIVGGTSVNRDREKLHRGTDILVATPGRLLDLIDQKAFNLKGVEILVLDEADQMLDLGFVHALRRVVQLVPPERQTLLFSATMPNSIKQLAGQFLNNPAHVSVAPASTTAERVEQYVCFLNQAEKQALLTITLREGFAAKEMDRVLVFTRTKHGADRVVRKLGQQGIRATAIHGNKSQPQRERALGEFKQGQVKVLVATDIAARGIDISGVSHVINFELPNVAEQYVHRIGRTARAGAEGVAIAFCAPDERPYLKDIQKLTKVTLEKVELPENFMKEVAKVNARQPGDNAVRNDEPREERSGQNHRPRRPKKKYDARPTNGERKPGGGGNRRRGNRNRNRSGGNGQGRAAG
ncbi:MAG: DEAD/DEAH box helicase [Sphingomonadaceae bacterium]